MSGSPSLALGAVCVSLDLMDVARSDGAAGMPRLARRVLIGPAGKLRLRRCRDQFGFFSFSFLVFKGDGMAPNRTRFDCFTRRRRSGQDRTDRRRVLFLVKCFFGARSRLHFWQSVCFRRPEFWAACTGTRVWFGDVNTTRRNGGKGRTEIQT